MARAMGVHGEGPITNPNDLGPAIKRAVDVVLREPALVDVVTQPDRRQCDEVIAALALPLASSLLSPLPP